jgi:hypothetical protein
MNLGGSVELALSEALGRVDRAWSAIPEHGRPTPDAERWRELEGEVNAAIRAGDDARALVAIQGWEAEAIGEIERVTP